MHTVNIWRYKCIKIVSHSFALLVDMCVCIMSCILLPVVRAFACAIRAHHNCFLRCFTRFENCFVLLSFFFSFSLFSFEDKTKRISIDLSEMCSANAHTHTHKLKFEMFKWFSMLSESWYDSVGPLFFGMRNRFIHSGCTKFILPQSLNILSL